MKLQILTSYFLLSSLIIACNTNHNLPEAHRPKDVMSDDTNKHPTGITSTVIGIETSKKQLFAPWAGLYLGVPAFDQVTILGLPEAMDEAIALKLAEIDVIANNPLPATFENTIVALERTGQVLDRLNAYFTVFSGNMSSPAFRKMEAEISPKLSALTSNTHLNTTLFRRVASIYQGEEMQQLTQVQQRVTYLTYNKFVRNGVTLNQDDKVTYRQINERLSTLETQFSNNLLADEETYVLYLTENN